MENQDAINTLYELAKLDGYENSMDDFKATMANNPEAVKTMYELALKDGYENSINDFSKLVGSKKKKLFRLIWGPKHWGIYFWGKFFGYSTIY